MSNCEIYHMPLSEAMKYVPVAQLVALINDSKFSAALLKACEQTSK